MTKKSYRSREVMDRKNERRRTYNAFRDLNSLLLEYKAGAIFGIRPVISPDEAKKYLRAIFFHYCGRIDPERSKMWIDSIKRIYCLMDDDYIPDTPHARELDTIQNDICDVMRELEYAKKLADRRNWKTE